MRLLIAAQILVMLIVLGCEKAPNKSETAKAPTTDIFQVQVLKFLEEASKLDQRVGQGIELVEFKAQLGAAKGLFEMVKSTQPLAPVTNSVNVLGKCVVAWDLALDLWERQDAYMKDRNDFVFIDLNAPVPPLYYRIVSKKLPVEPSLNRFEEYAQIAGDTLKFSVFPSNLDEELRGKRYLEPITPNVTCLLGIGSTNLARGRDLVLTTLKPSR